MNHGAEDAQSSLLVRATSKLNLTLEVGPPRADGYHPIASVMVPIDLTDELIITPAATGHWTLEIVDEANDVPVAAGEQNLVSRAAQRLIDEAKARGLTPGGAHVRLIKRIPVAAGLGGGSADAAAALVGLNRLWQLGFSADQLARLGAELGSDIPFCVYAKPALVEGTGELHTPLAGIARFAVVLVNPRRPLSTADVYARFDAASGGSTLGQRAAKMIEALHSGNPVHIADALHNDLEHPAEDLVPEIARIRSSLTHAGALGTQVAGSGPTVFGVASNLDEALKIAEECRRVGSDAGQTWWTWAGWGGDCALGQRIASYQTRQLQASP